MCLSKSPISISKPSIPMQRFSDVFREYRNETLALNGLRNLEIFLNVGFNCTLNLPTLIYSFRLKYGTKDFCDPSRKKKIHSKVYLSFYVGYS